MLFAARMRTVCAQLSAYIGTSGSVASRTSSPRLTTVGYDVVGFGGLHITLQDSPTWIPYCVQCDRMPNAPTMCIWP